MFTQISFLVVLVGVVVAAPENPYSAPAPAPHSGGYGKEQPMPYSFQYGVQDEYSGADFGQNEESDGNVVRGSYTVQLPDGRKQTVTYTADHYNGYQAQVEYYGEPQYAYEYGPPVTFKPQYSSHQPSYQPPQPSYPPPKPSYPPPKPSYPPPKPSYPPPQPSYPPPQPSYPPPQPSYQ